MVNIYYSVDKIKLEFQYIKFDIVQGLLNTLSMLDYDRYYESKQMTKCKHNFLFEEDGGSIYIGIVPNWKGENRDDKSIVVEYNPNKVDPFKYDFLKFLLRIPRACIRVMNFDVAVDMSIPYSDVRILKRDKREYYCEIGHSEIETRYLGSLGHNHVKLYNKAKEQGLNCSWTRFEITVKEINSLNCELREFDKINIPTMYQIRNQIKLDDYEQLNDITRIALEAIISDFSLLNTIKKYDTRKKYEKMIHDRFDSIIIDKKMIHNAYLNYSDRLFGSLVEDVKLIDISAIMIK